VSKIARLNDFLIPKLKKYDEDDEEYDDSGYEGAIVFDPTVGFYKESVWVNDYSSLYPSSMIATNISHETILKK
jgi:DNA polymerase elongation subunit (family B)